MNKSFHFFLSSIFFLSVIGLPSMALATLLGLSSNDITFSKNEPLVGDSIRVYAKIVNRGNDDMRGIVKFFEGPNKQVGSDQPFSILRGSMTDVFFDYPDLSYGEKKVMIKVVPWGVPNESFSVMNALFVDRDSDKDGIADRKDPDDDNDGHLDEEDAFPLDSTEWQDTDHDAIGDNKDKDDDNDGLSDEEEIAKGTDPKKWDTDGDGKSDKEDAFPLDAAEWQDTDHDGYGDTIDPDDDNDGICDVPPEKSGICHLNLDGSGDALSKDPTESIDTDHDGIGDNKDMDDDNDGIPDGHEKDLGTDPKKTDTDGDGINDREDAFPLDKNEWKDSDHDGLGDNADPNNKNKGPILKVKISVNITLLLPYYFDASETFDPDGSITNIWWELDGKHIDGKGFWYFFFTPGDHFLVLHAIDNAGEERMKLYKLYISGILYIVLVGIGGFGYLVFSLYRRGRKDFQLHKIRKKTLPKNKKKS